jgi:two-component system response regulator GlrR
MEQLHLISPRMPVIILTGYGSIESAVEAMKRGAYGYLTKPFDSQVLLFEIGKMMENRRMSSEIERLQGLLESKYSFSNIVANSKKMQMCSRRYRASRRRTPPFCSLGNACTGRT